MQLYWGPERNKPETPLNFQGFELKLIFDWNPTDTYLGLKDPSTGKSSDFVNRKFLENTFPWFQFRVQIQ
jgi:hypothetical protein